MPTTHDGRASYVDTLDRLRTALGGRAAFGELCRVEHEGIDLAVDGIVLGTRDPRSPCLMIVGGVHGLERIGTEVVLTYLEAIADRLRWDKGLLHLLSKVRLAVVPLVNPVGMMLGTRANGNGVDLMRNAPPHPAARGSLLVGGQRVSRRLPWYAGEPFAMEREALALIRFFEQHGLSSRLCIAIDCHSGFGFEDRIWFPYARSRQPFPQLAEVVKLESLMTRALPNHPYVVEPQARAYTIVGDLWDHMHDIHAAHAAGGTFLPLTLEMGSFTWIKKNPLQLFTPLGSFNPVVPHRKRRILRRHLPLFDFLLSLAFSPDAIRPEDDHERLELESAALARWR